MGKFKEGDKIKNSSLYVIEYVSNSRVLCGCSVCGKSGNNLYVSMVYNESDLEKGDVSCRFCSEVNKARVKGLYKDYDIYMSLLEKSLSLGLTTAHFGDVCVVTDAEEFDTPEKVLKYPLKEKYNDLTSVGYLTKVKKKDAYGIHYTLPSHIILKCESCNYTVFEPFADIGKSSNICPICSVLKAKYTKAEERREQFRIEADKVRSYKRDFNRIKTAFDRLATNKAMQKSVKTLETKNPDYKVIDISKDGGATTYQLACKKCGSVYSCMRSNKKLDTCKFCQEHDANAKGYLYKDYRGTVFNGLKILSQDGFTCEVQCVKCKKVRKGVDLYSVLGRSVYCDCEGSVIRIECPNCFAPLPDISYADVYRGKEIVCPSCNQVVDHNEFTIAIETLDYGNSLRSKLEMVNEGISDKANKKIKFGSKFAVDTLIMEHEPLYKGNDEHSYYRCFCKKHNIGLILSDDEIKDYHCEYCDDIRQRLIANPDAKSIKL